MKRISPRLVVSALVVLVLTGCEPAAQSGRGFTLPAGSAENGRIAFVDLKCFTCHKVSGSGDLPAPVQTVATPVVIGGEVVRVKTYGDLVTAIIHPSHRITGQLREQWEKESTLSPMPIFNDVMTVAQLVDLVTFLQPRYTKLEPLYEPYYLP